MWFICQEGTKVKRKIINNSIYSNSLYSARITLPLVFDIARKFLKISKISVLSGRSFSKVVNIQVVTSLGPFLL